MRNLLLLAVLLAADDGDFLPWWRKKAGWKVERKQARRVHYLQSVVSHSHHLLQSKWPFQMKSSLSKSSSSSPVSLLMPLAELIESRKAQDFTHWRSPPLHLTAFPIFLAISFTPAQSNLEHVASHTDPDPQMQNEYVDDARTGLNFNSLSIRLDRWRIIVKCRITWNQIYIGFNNVFNKKKLGSASSSRGCG